MKKYVGRIILIVACVFVAVYYLYPTWKDYNLRQQMNTLRGADSLQYVTNHDADIRDARARRIKLGLDLQGGMRVVLEVNANPERLDLCDRHVKLARDRGLKIVISTDAHRPEHFAFMRYGVMTARRGWMEKKGVLNTYPPEKLLASLRPLPK